MTEIMSSIFFALSLMALMVATTSLTTSPPLTATPEAVSASWMFDPRYKRAIHVDMRYLRWLLAKVYPAPNLLKEMNLPAE